MQLSEKVIQDWLNEVDQSMKQLVVVKISLGGYRGAIQDLKQVHIKPVEIKRELKYSFVNRYKTKDITKNHSPAETANYLKEVLGKNDFQIATLFTTTEQLIIQQNKGQWRLRRVANTQFKSLDLLHDKQKNRKIATQNNGYLHALGLADEQGNIFKSGQDKFKQINHYIELLSTHLKGLPKDRTLEIVDMGAGKGYLTFALYDYINHELKQKAAIKGVEYRNDLVELCNQIAMDTQFENLTFQQGTIENYEPSKDQLDVLIALHACDTATDDAIAKGIRHQAELIVVAPCCHKQIRRELEKIKAENDLAFMTRHGIFMERHAEMLTDGIRALLLEYFGYQVKVQQFISDAHTPKNVMIVATRKNIHSEKQKDILLQLKELKSYFGITHHYLERILKVDVS